MTNSTTPHASKARAAGATAVAAGVSPRHAAIDSRAPKGRHILHTRAAPSRSPRLAPALTLLEVVLAVVILGLVTAAITGAISAIESMNAHSRQTVAAYEIAHRLVLTYLDDDDRMPSESKPLDYGFDRFMWDKREETIRMSINDAQRSSGSTPQALGRFRLVTFNVYLTDNNGPQAVKGPLVASLSRMYDPAAPRNPDSISTMNDPRKIQRLIHGILNDSDIGATTGQQQSPRAEKAGGRL